MSDLSPVAQKFVLHWGEMGTRWGINRTVAQVYALLFVSERPLHAEEIAGTLSIARSSVSTAIRELQGWGIIRVVHVLGDRRDHFESLADVWEMFRVIVQERKRREIDPTLALLRECVEDSGRAGASSAHATARLGELLQFMEITSSAYEQVRAIPTPALKKLAKMAGRLPKLLGV